MSRNLGHDFRTAWTTDCSTRRSLRRFHIFFRRLLHFFETTFSRFSTSSSTSSSTTFIIRRVLSAADWLLSISSCDSSGFTVFTAVMYESSAARVLYWRARRSIYPILATIGTTFLLLLGECSSLIRVFIVAERAVDVKFSCRRSTNRDTICDPSHLVS